MGASFFQMWYVLDEFGSRFRQCADAEDANATFCPFYFHTNKTMYEVFWPTKDIGDGEEVLRDWVAGHTTEK
jgi:hypothetical protein